MAACRFAEVLCRFPSINEAEIGDARRVVDQAFKSFVRVISPYIDIIVAPLQRFLNSVESLLITSPWAVVFLCLLGVVFLASRNWLITCGTAIALFAIGLVGLWTDMMVTVAMVVVSTVIAIAIGAPLGIAMSASHRFQRTMNPILDVMQTLPVFVYLIPIVMIFGIGKVPGLVAVVIYALPPIIRLTDLGIRLVDKETLEAADAYGASPWQKLKSVQIPLALPTIMTGVNQTIMMSLAMVVVASMVGVGGLGRNVLQAINNQYFTMGILNGAAIVALAIIIDRATQAFAHRVQWSRSNAT